MVHPLHPTPLLAPMGISQETSSAHSSQDTGLWEQGGLRKFLSYPLFPVLERECAKEPATDP